VGDLGAVPAKWWTPDPSIVAKLPRGGNGDPKSCSVCGGWHKAGAVHLDYVGHADLTRALIEIDPLCDWQPLAFTPEGLPLVTERKNQLVLWGRMTLLGTTRLCVGSCDNNKSDAEKELIGDLLRNGGMRFGVFGALWSKAHGWETESDEAAEPRPGRVFPSNKDVVRAASPKQVGFASKLMAEVVHVNLVAQYIEDTIGRASPLEELSTAEMSKLIDKLQDERKAGRTADGDVPAGEPW
jgi:hypothetical protein